MDVEDLLEPEVAVGAAIAAAIFSPKVRGLLRRGAVYGLAGALVAGDAVTAAAKGVGTSVRQAGEARAQRAGQHGDGQASGPDGAEAAPEGR
jgi:hypothetical protein